MTIKADIVDPPARPEADPAAWRLLVDVSRLEAWMDGRGLGDGPLGGFKALTGGTQNLLLRFERAGRPYVLRRAPLNPYLDGSETMRREARVLGALAGSDAPHPRLIAACPEESVLGQAFYLMEPVEGFAPTQGMPALHAGDPGVRHAMGLAVIDALAALQRVDPATTGLDGFGKPIGFLERQSPRWLKQLASYEQYAGWDGRGELPGLDRIAAWLADNVPAVTRVGVIHGDFHLGNVMFSPQGPEVRAIVDWELSTLGDPMIDLGCLLATWADPDGAHPGCISVTPWSGFPTEAELVARYAALTGRAAADVNWFVVLACFKLGILQEGTYARAFAGQADMALGRWMHATSINLFNRALGRI